MPRKNREEYNEYMRNYMKKKNRENKGQPVLDNDFDPSATSDKPVLDLNKTSDLIKETQNLLRNKKTDSEATDDPLLNAIEKYGKYIPIAMKFFDGLKGSLSQFNPQQQNKNQAPDGWLNMSGLQKLGLKHTRSEWYAAGEAYDLAIETGQINPQINISHVDPNYKDPVPKSLKDLNHKYPEAPLVNETAPVREKPEEKKEEKAETKTEHSVDANQIVSELQKDNAKYIDLGADFINKLSDKDFINHLENIDKLIIKAKPFIPMIPIHVKGMIAQTSKEDLENLFKEKCSEKFKIVQKEKLKKKLLELFENLQKIIGSEK